MLETLFTNKILITSLLSWFVAQVLKFIIYYLINGKIDITRLIGDGGMPSGHSATVTALAFMSGVVYGVDSGVFAIALVLAIIVMHDAMGVRLETGKQAKIINMLVNAFEDINHIEITNDMLKEFVGHTPFQVICGSILGVIVSLIMTAIYFWWLF